MVSIREVLKGCDRGRLIRSVAFFALFYLFVWLWIDPKLLYYASTQLPYGLRRGFLRLPYVIWTFSDCPLRPGEPIDYLALCFSQYYRYSWLGALLITATAWLLSFSSKCVITAIGGDRFGILHFVPPIIVGALFCRRYFYVYYISDSLGLSVALLMSYFYMRMPLKNMKLRIFSFLVLLTSVYVVASLSYTVFILLCCIFESSVRRNSAGAICIVILGVITPYLMSYIYNSLTIKDAYYYTFWFAPLLYDEVSLYLQYGLYLCMPFVALVCILARALTTETTDEPTGSGNNRFAQAIGTLILLVVSLGTLALSSDLTRRRVLKIMYYARQEMWSELLDQAQAFGNDPEFYYGSFLCCDINRALYHTGQLADEMFSYPQQYSGLLPDNSSGVSKGHLLIRLAQSRSDLLYELGHINHAEDQCYEVLTKFRNCPWILQKLALINIVKQQPDAARVYLAKLLKNPYCDYRNWAQNYLEKLKKDPLLLEDAEIQHQRNLIVPNDTIIVKNLVPKLLEDDIPNQMAYEYFAAQCLTSGDLRKFIVLFKHLHKFNFPEIPRHYQEAILLYSLMTKKNVDLQFHKLDPQIHQRFQKFMRILNDNIIYDTSPDMSALQGEFGDTFYFYYFFKMPPKQPLR